MLVCAWAQPSIEIMVQTGAPSKLRPVLQSKLGPVHTEQNWVQVPQLPLFLCPPLPLQAETSSITSSLATIVSKSFICSFLYKRSFVCEQLLLVIKLHSLPSVIGCRAVYLQFGYRFMLRPSHTSGMERFFNSSPTNCFLGWEKNGVPL